MNSEEDATSATQYGANYGDPTYNDSGLADEVDELSAGVKRSTPDRITISGETQPYEEPFLFTYFKTFQSDPAKIPWLLLAGSFILGVIVSRDRNGKF